jgi:predicted nucleic acid-binding protein
VPIDEERHARLRVLREQASDIVVPAAVLAEGVMTGRFSYDRRVRQLMGVVRVAEVDESLGYAAGLLRHAAIHGGLDPAPSGIDAIVVMEADALAAREQVLMVTTDVGDFEALASCAVNVDRLSVLGA